jgi:hypothetical protein
MARLGSIALGDVAAFTKLKIVIPTSRPRPHRKRIRRIRCIVVPRAVFVPSAREHFGERRRLREDECKDDVAIRLLRLRLCARKNGAPLIDRTTCRQRGQSNRAVFHGA